MCQQAHLTTQLASKGKKLITTLPESFGTPMQDERMPSAYHAPKRQNAETDETATMLQGETEIRVRYAETDRMGLLHHANYLVYFEQARTDLLRNVGHTYKDLEDQGYFLVLTRIEVKYKSPAYYDDVLTIRTTVTRTTPVRLEHAYAVFNSAGKLCAEGSTTLACVDREGRIQAMPAWLSEAK